MAVGREPERPALALFAAELRAAVLSFMVISFLAAGIAGFFGAMLNKYAPVHGGPTVQLSRGESK